MVCDLRMTPRVPPPVIDECDVDQLADVDFQGDQATAPIGFKNSGCGLLLLWTREKQGNGREPLAGSVALPAPGQRLIS